MLLYCLLIVSQFLVIGHNGSHDAAVPFGASIKMTKNLGNLSKTKMKNNWAVNLYCLHNPCAIKVSIHTAIRKHWKLDCKFSCDILQTEVITRLFFQQCHFITNQLVFLWHLSYTVDHLSEMPVILTPTFN